MTVVVVTFICSLCRALAMSGVRVKSQIEVPRSKFHLDLEGIHAALKTCASEILNKLESQTAAEWTFHRIQV